MFVCCFAVSNAWGEPAAEAPTSRWAKAIGQFEEWDSKNSHPSKAVLFVGSSSIRRWRTRDSFPDLPVINRGFGGSQISDVNQFAHRIVLPYKPKLIVFYAGDNDIASGKTPQRVFEDYRKFVKLVHGKLPKTRIIFISIKYSRSRWSLRAQAEKANMMVKDFSEKAGRLFFVDAATPLLAGDAGPNPELFLDDKLHLSDKGYKIWTDLLTPVIQDALKSRVKRRPGSEAN